MQTEGFSLLQSVAVRILVRYLERAGARDVIRVPPGHTSSGRGVDLTYAKLGGTIRAKVKADPYCGVDPVRIADLELAFYRRRHEEYALETIGEGIDRPAGWAASSDADELLYYFLAIEQTEDEIRDLVADSDDEVFFRGIRVARDDLRIIPMDALRDWFVEHQRDFPSRPVRSGAGSAWYRLVPTAVLEDAVPGVVRVGSIYRL